MYKMIGADGQEYGPVSLEQLKDWVAQRRVNAQTKVQSAGSSDWLTAAEMPELASLFGSRVPKPAAPSAPPILTAPAAKGPSNGLAVMSFILGLSSFVLCLGLLAGVPAIICGHIARRRTRQLPERYGGAGFAKAGLILGYMSILLSALVVTMLVSQAQRSNFMSEGNFMPDRNRMPQRNDCENNLRQLGLAFKVWALEHNDQYSFNVSTNAGGSLELCARGADGFETNPVPHLLVISHVLTTPNFLVCPNDSAKHAAPDFSSLQLINISYRLRTGTNINGDNPQEVLAVCPVHGNELFCDGNVRKRPAQKRVE